MNQEAPASIPAYLQILMSREALGALPNDQREVVSDAVETVRDVANAFLDKPDFRNEAGTLTDAGEVFTQLFEAIDQVSKVLIDDFLDFHGVPDLRVEGDDA